MRREQNPASGEARSRNWRTDRLFPPVIKAGERQARGQEAHGDDDTILIRGGTARGRRVNGLENLKRKFLHRARPPVKLDRRMVMGHRGIFEATEIPMSAEGS